MGTVTTTHNSSIDEALQGKKRRAVQLLGQLERNQGQPTFTGRMTLDQFVELSVVHNKRWAEGAGESLDSVTQRDIIEAHAAGLALFMLQGLLAATRDRARHGGVTEEVITEIERLQDHLGRGAHYGLPQVTLVLPTEPECESIQESSGETVATRLFLMAGTLFAVADGQHRREAAWRVRDFLTELVKGRRVPKAKFIPDAGIQDQQLSNDQLEAWTQVQETFRSWTVVAYEAHIGLTVDQARQMFTNYNCHVKPVRPDLNLQFDQSNPINRFAKEWLKPMLETTEAPLLDLRQLGSVNGLLFLGKTSIKTVPYNVQSCVPTAKEFWTSLMQSPDWAKKNGTFIHDVPVIKGLAKAWFMVFLARRKNKLDKAAALRKYLRETAFGSDWIDTVPGLRGLTIPGDKEQTRFSPAHNEIVPKIVNHILG